MYRKSKSIRNFEESKNIRGIQETKNIGLENFDLIKNNTAYWHDTTKS